MGAFSLQLFPDDLQRTSQDVYEVQIGAWGSNIKDCYPFTQALDFTPTNSPGFPFSPAAIALGPSSTVDRAFFSWNPMLDHLFFGQSTAVPRMLTLDSPLAFPTPAGSGAIAPGDDLQAALLKQVMYAFPAMGTVQTGGEINSTGLPEHYLLADGTQRDFFIDAFPDPTIPQGLITPTLHLQFFRRLPAVFTTKRLVLRASRIEAYAFDGTDNSVIIAPIYGRKSVTATFGSDAADITWRVATLHAMTWGVIPQEVTQDTKGPLAANASDKIVLSNPCADYVLLYGKKGAAGNANIRATVTASD
jgi:hypothetical protein